MKNSFFHFVTGTVLTLALATPSAHAQKYDPGASDTEIKIGNTMPYSGPASAYGIIGKTEAAYFAMINQQGGINGRKINFISRDRAQHRQRPKGKAESQRIAESWRTLARGYEFQGALGRFISFNESRKKAFPFIPPPNRQTISKRTSWLHWA